MHRQIVSEHNKNKNDMVQPNENDQREKDIQQLCSQVLNMSAETDYNPNGANETTCPMCAARVKFITEMSELPHTLTCGYLIAKDLSAKQK